MEFRFNVNKILPKRINKITHTLIPEEFRGDRRELLECQRQLSKIVDEIGEASARAQGLNKPITSVLKLRDTDHIIYLLVDNEGNNGLGCIIGLLKTGSKNLFMFDEKGEHYQLQPRCVLDFYIHESRQRMGLGNTLYQHMLNEENLRPIKLAIDRPSEKFLAFLQKYYNLTTTIPQNNKFVVFTGFFDDEMQDVKTNKYGVAARRSIESTYSKPNQTNHSNVKNNKNSVNEIPISRSAFGRYAAARPPCHMANIIHNTAILGQPTERNGTNCPSISTKIERPHSLSIYFENKQETEKTMTQGAPTFTSPILNEDSQKEIESGSEIKFKEADQENQIEVFKAVNIPETTNCTKSSPSYGQEVGNQPAHLDIKFYHSPLW